MTLPPPSQLMPQVIYSHAQAKALHHAPLFIVLLLPLLGELHCWAVQSVEAGFRSPCVRMQEQRTTQPVAAPCSLPSRCCLWCLNLHQPPTCCCLCRPPYSQPPRTASTL